MGKTRKAQVWLQIADASCAIDKRFRRLYVQLWLWRDRGWPGRVGGGPVVWQRIPVLFVLFLIMWTVIVYSLYIAIRGNPLPRLVAEQPVELLEHLDQQFEARGGAPEAGGSTADFIRRFSRSALFELLAFVLELGLLFFLVLAWEFEVAFYFWLCVALLLKNLAAFGFSWNYSRSMRHSQGLFKHLLRIPSWVGMLDRLSAALSAAGFILLLLHIFNHWMGGGEA